MNYRIVLHPEAVTELEESFRWYEERREGLGRQFIEIVNNQLQKISSNPEIYSKAKKNYREAGMDRFPYIIVYEILQKEQTVFVSHIFHTKRNPALKFRKK